MSRRTAYFSSDYDDFEDFVQQIRGSFRGVKIESKDERLERGGSDTLLNLPNNRWGLGSNTGKKMNFGDLYEGFLKKAVKDCFLQYPSGYLAFVASGGGDIKEIVFVKDGAQYKRKVSKKDIGKMDMPDVALLAVHESHVALRALRKLDSLVTNAWYVPATAPLDLAIWLEGKVKSTGKKAKVVAI